MRNIRAKQVPSRWADKQVFTTVKRQSARCRSRRSFVASTTAVSMGRVKGSRFRAPRTTVGFMKAKHPERRHRVGQERVLGVDDDHKIVICAGWLRRDDASGEDRLDGLRAGC